MISLTIHLPPMAKARPRVTRRGTYMPREYVAWKKEFCRQANEAIWIQRTENVRVAARFFTPTGNCRPDLDNCMGAVLDSLQDAGVIKNDRQVKAGSYSIAKGPTCIRIEIEPLTTADHTPTTQIRKRPSALERK